MTKSPRKLKLALVLPIVVLIAAIGFQGIDFFREKHVAKPPHLQQVIPRDVAGWKAQDVDLGPNEFMKEKVEKVLNYDEFVHRFYTKPGKSFSLYIGYWGPGKMPTRLVASHTPDRCWTENGWKCLDMKFREQYSVDGDLLQPAEWRRFLPPDGSAAKYVIYWHLVDDKAYDYGGRFNAVPHPLKWLEDAISQARKGSPEQYFIRLISDEPFERIWYEEGFQKVLRAIADLGVKQTLPPVPAS